FGFGAPVVNTDLAGNYAVDASWFDEGAAAGTTCTVVSVSAANYIGLSGQTVSASPPFPGVVNFALASSAGALVSGVITDRATGTPLAGAQVTLYGNRTVSTQTDANGAYTFTGDQYPYTGNTV